MSGAWATHKLSNGANQSKADKKFKEAKAQLERSVQKHLESQELEASSEEEDLESESIFDSVLQNYSRVGGKNEDLGRTQNFLESSFQSGAAVCLICIGSVKRADSIWSCISCYGFFHLLCIQRWAKDSIAHQKMAAEDRPDLKKVDFSWHCPKCREDYDSSIIPYRYECFCGQTLDPPFHPWLVPHSCGQICGKSLVPDCGHSCLLLCHPGPCPPCPKMVKSRCFCRKAEEKTVRCSKKEWSCGGKCGLKLSCSKHSCPDICHKNECSPCQKTSQMRCECSSQTRLSPCAQLSWNCDKVCGKDLNCGKHKCETVCHKGDCGPCPRSLPRSCPCGKEIFLLSCTEDVPTCGGTCGKTLQCGLHTCSQRCHRGDCGSCLEFLEKQCRCGSHTKEIHCSKEFICETKCRAKRDCFVHLCNRKCCDGRCPPCEKPCGKTLRCGQHKCSSVCHRGACYPCQLTKTLSCRCGASTLVVPCGTSKRKKTIKCNRLCTLPPDCHHAEREDHRCHQGACPNCKQICNKERSCGHNCTLPCHSSVLVSAVPNYKPSTPWESVNAPYEIKDLPCPNCIVPVDVWCPGKHELMQLPCHRAIPQACGSPCGRVLPCSNHHCSLLCHEVTNPFSPLGAGVECEDCSEECEADRLCSHPCTMSCHPPPCPTCQVSLKLRCHCGINFVYLKCHEWTGLNEEERAVKLSCGNQCPKNYSCGHRCTAFCHLGECVESTKCRKKVKINCPCKRLKKEVVCCLSATTSLSCDSSCYELKAEKVRKEQEEARLAEEKRNREELEKYEKKLSSGGKRYRTKKKTQNEDVTPSFMTKYKFYIAATSVVLLSLFIYSFCPYK